jgi:tetratricopeptide (TPR) repeat protein
MKSWLLTITGKPAMIFQPIAHVTAVGALHGDWSPLPGLTVVAQIRAMVEGDDTLDTLPETLPASVFVEAAKWAGVEENAVWHRKLAVCLSNAGYLDPAVEHFRMAINMDNLYVEARNGLAFTYPLKACFNQVIELESERIGILNQRLSDTGPRSSVVYVKQQLSRSYGGIARNYGRLGNDQLASHFWGLAAKTGEMTKWGINSYLESLAREFECICWPNVMELLKTLEKKQESETQSLLSYYLQQERFVAEHYSNFHYLTAHAAKQTNSLEWLVNAYDNAISCSNSHLTVIVLKSALIRFYKDFADAPVKAESLILEIGDTVRMDQDSTVPELDRWKSYIGQDFYLICVRKAAEAGFSSETAHASLGKISSLCASKVPPSDMRSKIVWAEDGPLYLSLIQRLMGRTEEAVAAIRPFLAECCTMVTDHNSEWGLVALAESILALGQIPDFWTSALLYGLGQVGNALNVTKYCPDLRGGRYANIALCGYVVIAFHRRVVLPIRNTVYLHIIWYIFQRTREDLQTLNRCSVFEGGY